MTKDPLLTKFLGVMLRNQRFFVEFNYKKSRVRLQRKGLPQGSVLAPLLYNINHKEVCLLLFCIISDAISTIHEIVGLKFNDGYNPKFALDTATDFLKQKYTINK